VTFEVCSSPQDTLHVASNQLHCTQVWVAPAEHPKRPTSITVLAEELTGTMLVNAVGKEVRNSKALLLGAQVTLGAGRFPPGGFSLTELQVHTTQATRL
jgi:hypothetical protein